MMTTPRSFQRDQPRGGFKVGLSAAVCALAEDVTFELLLEIGAQ